MATQDDPRAVSALKYMLLCKIMLNLPDDVNSIIASKLGKRYAGADVDAMKAVATAHEHRSLDEYQEALRAHREHLSDDPIIRNHLASLYDTLLEQNIVRVIEPYSKVEIEYVAQTVKQPTREVESKLSQMILDKVFHGILDQGAGTLIVFEEPEDDVGCSALGRDLHCVRSKLMHIRKPQKTYEASLDVMKHVGQVVESLYVKAQKLR